MVESALLRLCELELSSFTTGSAPTAPLTAPWGTRPPLALAPQPHGASGKDAPRLSWLDTDTDEGVESPNPESVKGEPLDVDDVGV